MRIAFVVETWIPSTDGIVTRLVATCRNLLDTGHRVLVVCPRPGDAAACDARRDARVRVRTVPTAGWSFVYGGQRWGLPVPAVSRYLREFRPDVVHVVNPVLLGIAGALTARRHHIPLVASYHTNVAMYAGYYHLAWLRPLIWRVVGALHRAAALNLATSRMGAHELTSHGVHDVRIWPRGVDLDLFHPGPPAAAPHSGTPMVLYVGRLAAEKDLLRLRPFATPGDGFRLTMVGGGPQADRLRSAMGPQVRFTGVLHGPALADAYRSADVFAFPSSTDTLGLVVLEALASGLPVVAVDSVASRELLAGCTVAALVPPGDAAAMRTAVGALAARARADPAVATVARRFAERYGWREATTWLARRYRHVADRRTPDLPETGAATAKPAPIASGPALRGAVEAMGARLTAPTGRG